jgi:hypothetical protein
MIKKFYYTVWTDVILQLQKNPLQKKSWKWYSLFVMSFCFGANYVPLLLLFPNNFNPFRLFSEFHIFNSDFLNILIHSMIIFLLPGYILNYFFVFYKKKYEKFTKEYKFHNGKLFMRYMLMSFMVPVLLLVIVLFIKWVFY